MAGISLQKLLKHDHGKQLGYAFVIAGYHENNRDGKPCHHQMFVSYDLKKRMTNG